MKSSSVKSFFITIFIGMFSFQSHALEKDALTLLDSIQQSQDSIDQAILAGKTRSSLCGYCHGETGTSERNYIPNLAGQNVEYLLHQFELFATGKRKQSVMEELAASLTIADQVNLAFFYSVQEPVRHFDVQGDIAKGKVQFEQFCSTCHGLNGEGNKVIPKLATQPQEYLKATLLNLKNKSNIRIVKEMEPTLDKLSEGMIVDISAYLAAIE